MKDIYVDSLPKCDLCNTDNSAVYDGPVRTSGHANMCSVCYSRYGLEFPGTYRRIVGTDPRAEGPHDEVAYAEALSFEELEAMVMDGEDCVAVDGCTVEPDGKCSHGFSSPLLLRGLICLICLIQMFSSWSVSYGQLYGGYGGQLYGGYGQLYGGYGRLSGGSNAYYYPRSNSYRYDRYRHGYITRNGDIYGNGFHGRLRGHGRGR